MKRLPKAVFISHGGGPLPLLHDQGHREMVSCLRTLAESLPRPDAILVVSAHWEEAMPTLTAARQPSVLYDYHGFPPESYEIQYPCAGDPALAGEVHRLLQHHGLAARLDETRGLDHGVFVPLKILYPEADIPCVQLSLVATLDPAAHIQMGTALESLAGQNVLVVGSGFTFHNLSAFYAPRTPNDTALNEAFEHWLQRTCSATEITEAERARLLTHWEEAPGARFCHPREEHLLPLLVCYGAARSACAELHPITIMDRKTSLFVW